MLMPFEWDVRVSSKDHTVTAFTSATTQTTTVALHHYARLNFDGRLRLLEVQPNLTSSSGEKRVRVGSERQFLHMPTVES